MIPTWTSNKKKEPRGGRCNQRFKSNKNKKDWRYRTPRWNNVWRAVKIYLTTATTRFTSLDNRIHEYRLFFRCHRGYCISLIVFCFVGSIGSTIPCLHESVGEQEGAVLDGSVKVSFILPLLVEPSFGDSSNMLATLGRVLHDTKEIGAKTTGLLMEPAGAEVFVVFEHCHSF